MRQALQSFSEQIRDAPKPDFGYAAQPVREAIRAAALELFARQGFHAISVRKLAACVGMQPGSLYVHFATKHEVLAELIEDYEECLAMSIKQALGTTRGPQDLQKYVRASLLFSVENPDSTTLALHDSRFLSTGLREGIESARMNRRRMLASILQSRHGTHCADVSFIAAGIESVILIAAQTFAGHEHDSFDHLVSRTFSLVQNMTGLSCERSREITPNAVKTKVRRSV